MRRRNRTLEAEPNAAHRAVAEQEKSGPTPYDDRADDVVREPTGTAPPKLLARLTTKSDRIARRSVDP